MEIDLKKFLNVLVKYEGLMLHAYQDSCGIWTIGIGTIQYPDGTRVKRGDKVTEAQAYEYAEHEAKQKLAAIKPLLKVEQTEAQLTALLSLTYNIGVEGLKTSSVLRSINKKAPLPEIEANWYKWCRGTVNGRKVTIQGLLNRRISEFKIYAGITKLI